MDGLLLTRRELSDDLVAALTARAAAVDREANLPHDSLGLLHAAGLMKLTAAAASAGRRRGWSAALRDVLCACVHTPQPNSAFTAAGRAALG